MSVRTAPVQIAPPLTAYDVNSWSEKATPAEIAKTFTRECLLEAYRLMRESESDAVRLGALKELLDRGHGKPVAAVELSGPGGQPIAAARIDLTRLSDDEFRTFRGLALKAKADEGNE